MACPMPHNFAMFLASYTLMLFTITILVSSNEGSFCRSSLFTLHKNRYLPGHVIDSMLVTSSVDCAMHCLTRDECQSWNMRETQSGLICELNDVTMETASQSNVHLLTKEGAQFGQRLSSESTDAGLGQDEFKRITYLFTTLDAVGNSGPTDVTPYDGTSLEGHVTLNDGIQEWTVPHTGTYEIEAKGASGANGTCTRDNHTDSVQLGGLGAKMKGKFSFTNGAVLKILVGQSGIMNTKFGDRPGGGGGGSFVTFGNNNIPLIIAGGGGGGGGCVVKLGISDGEPGQQGILGSQCNTSVKQGGVLCPTEVGFDFYAGAGAGLLGNGDGASVPPGSYAFAFVNGGNGGWCPIGSLGGFGGGGFGWLVGGGGGGYSGGGVWGNSTTCGVAGGGGSFNNGYDQEAGGCDSFGHGLVKIDLIGKI